MVLAQRVREMCKSDSSASKSCCSQTPYFSTLMSDYLIHRRVTLKSRHAPTRKTHHFLSSLGDDGLIRGPELPAPHALMIAQLRPDQGFYLLYLNEKGNEITDTYHESLEKALSQAKWEFNVELEEWELA